MRGVGRLRWAHAAPTFMFIYRPKDVGAEPRTTSGCVRFEITQPTP